VDLEARIAEKEQRVRDLEAKMASADFYKDREQSAAVVQQHQSVMWEVGDLMHQWEVLQTEEPVE
jgi:hypothetical protein